MTTGRIDGASLARAWSRYTELFGEVPHGTEQQMAALLELIPSSCDLCGSTDPKVRQVPYRVDGNEIITFDGLVRCDNAAFHGEER